MKKKFAALGLAFFLGLMPVFSYGSGIIDEGKYELNLGQGVTFKKTNAFYEWGVQNFNVLEMDLKNPSLKLDLLFNKSGFSQRLNLTDMVNQDSNVIAAVNGDFFSMSTPGFSIGPMVKDGKVLSNAHYDINKYASFLIDGNGNPLMAYVYPGVTIENQTKGNVTNVAAINKPSSNYGNIVVLTKEYMKNSPGASTTYFDLTEVVVENNIVREVRFGQPSVPVPENGYVLVAGGANSYVLSGNFAAGDTVNLKTELSLSYPDVKFAVGGGTMLVKDGAATAITQSVKGKSQRTALGLTRDQHLLIVTVDGRKSPYIGMEEKDMQSYMLGLGVKDAMMLDGGGSTQMVLDGKIQNDMTSGQRALVNGLAVKSAVPAGPVSTIEVQVFKDIIFQGEKIEIAARGKDASGNPVMLSTSDFQVNGEGITGTFDGRYFIPASAGKGAIIASYGGVSARKEIEVLSKGVPDSRYIAQGSAVPSVTILPDMSSQTDSVMDNAIKAKLQSVINTSPVIITAGNKDSLFEKGITSPLEAFGGAYKTKTEGNTTYISIDNRNGGIYKVKGQWDYLKGLLSNGSQNIVIVMQGSDQSGDAADKNAFDKIIQSAAKNKNIYVVYKAKSFTTRMDGYVSYIGIPDYGAMSKNSLSDIKYLEFYNNNGVLNYTFKNLF